MSEETPSVAHAVARRTVLKTAAWSVPIVAAAVAAPLAAASTTLDLQLVADPRGETLRGTSPDRLHVYDLDRPASYSALTMDPSPVPAGSIVTVSYDARLFSGPWLALDSSTGTRVDAASITTSGAVATATFVLPVGIPVAGSLTLWPQFAPPTGSTPPWYPDLQPFSVSIAAPAGVTDTDLRNNVVTSTPVYTDTADGALTATWHPVTLAPSNGGTTKLAALDSMTITANAPGDIPSGTLAVLSTPQVAEASGWKGAYDSVTLTGATLNGVDVTPSVKVVAFGAGSNVFYITVDTVIPAGQSLVATFDTQVVSTPITGIEPTGKLEFSVPNGLDRDTSNNVIPVPVY